MRPYVLAVRSAHVETRASLAEQHQVRLRCAEESLAPQPLKDCSVSRYIEEARQSLLESGQIPAEAFDWLPDVTANFSYLQ